MVESPALSAAVASFAGFERAPPPTRFALGVAALDAVLGGGLMRARLHEIYADGAVDMASAAGFALLLALLGGGTAGNIVWIGQAREAAPLYPPGLTELGLDPARLLFVTAPDAASLLRTAADVIRSPAAGMVVVAPPLHAKPLDLTVSRRLTLFAERSGSTAILLAGCAEERPSAAATRWRVAAAPSGALEADAPGAPAFALDLVRQRAGPPAPGWRLEWDRDAATFRPALSGGVPAAAGERRLAG